MTVRELIRDLLFEVGKSKTATKIYDELNESEEANTEIGVDIDGEAIRYVEKIANEFPSHFAFVLERE